VSDIANELRRAAQPLHAPTTELIKEAADELERLEAENRALRKALDTIKMKTSQALDEYRGLRFKSVEFLDGTARAALAKSEVNDDSA